MLGTIRLSTLFAVSLALGCALFVVPSVQAQRAALLIDDVSFDTVGHSSVEGDWLLVEIDLRGGTPPEGSSPRHVDDIDLSFAMAFEKPDSSFLFVQSEVKIATLTSTDAATVRFLLPPQIRARDRLSGEPFAWHVQLSAMGQSVPTERSHVSSSLASRERLASFRSRLEAEVGETAGFLLPIYRTPFYNFEFPELMVRTPAYVIREGR